MRALKNIQNRKGRFRVSTNLMSEGPDRVADVFSRLKLLIVGVKHDPFDIYWEFVALSENFDEVVEGQTIPEYLFIINTVEGAIESVRAEKI